MGFLALAFWLRLGLICLRLRQLLTTNSPFSTLDVSSMNNSKLAGRFQSSAEQTGWQPRVSDSLRGASSHLSQDEMLPLIPATVPLVGWFPPRETNQAL